MCEIATGHNRLLQPDAFCSKQKVRLDAFSVAVEVFFVLFLWAGAKNTAAKTLGLIKNEWKTQCFHRSTGFGVNVTLSSIVNFVRRGGEASLLKVCAK